MKSITSSRLCPFRILLAIAGLALAVLPTMAAAVEEQKQEEPKGDPDLAPASTRALGYEFDTLAHEIAEIENRIKGTKDIAAKLTAIATKYETSLSSLPAVAPSADFKTWAEKLKPDSTQPLTNADLTTVFTLVEVFAKEATRPFTDAAKEIDTAIDSAASSFDLQSEDSALGKEFDQYGVRFAFFGSNATLVPILVQFMPELQNCAVVRTSLSRLAATAPADAALREILHQACKNITEKGTTAVAKATKDAIGKLITAAKKDAGTAQDKNTETSTSLNGKKARWDKLNKELSFREKEGSSRKDKVAADLTDVILYILLTIIAGLLLLRFRQDDLSMLMVRERTVIEVVSIGAFLSVVAYLGAGDFIPKETLGTLLGTLAGYLFTRRSTPTPPTEGGSQAGTLGTPGKPQWSLPARTLTLNADTPGALKHNVWFIDLSLTTPAAPATARKIGETSTRSFTVPPDLLTAGHHCQAWFQAVNAAGDGPEGPRSDFTV